MEAWSIQIFSTTENFHRPELSFKLISRFMMWGIIITSLLSIALYFWDIGVDILVGKEQIQRTFPEELFSSISRRTRSTSIVKNHILIALYSSLHTLSEYFSMSISCMVSQCYGNCKQCTLGRMTMKSTC